MALKKWIYVQAHGNKEGIITFNHTYVMADSDTSAYSCGLNWFEANRPPLTGFEMLNDYVVELK